MFYDAHGECHCPEWGQWEQPHSSYGRCFPTRAADHGSSHGSPVNQKWINYRTEQLNFSIKAPVLTVRVWIWWLAPTWHCMRASCNEDLHSSSELPNLSQWLFMSFSLACSSRDSSVSNCTNSALHRLMDSTIALRLSYAFCSSCSQKCTFYI